MKHLLSALGLTLALSGLSLTRAQQPQPADAGTGPAAAIHPGDGSRLPELNVQDLPLEEVVRLLRRHFPETNFILPEELNEVMVRLELRNVNLAEILQAIEIAGRSEGLVPERVDERLVTFRRDDASFRAGTPKPVLRAFPLGGYFAGKDEPARTKALEDLLRLLDDAWMMLQGADPSLRRTPPPNLRIHEGTQMVISVGNLEQMRVLEEIVQNLPGMHGYGRGGGGQPGSEVRGTFDQRLREIQNRLAAPGSNPF